MWKKNQRGYTEKKTLMLSKKTVARKTTKRRIKNRIRSIKEMEKDQDDNMYLVPKKGSQRFAEPTLRN